MTRKKNELPLPKISRKKNNKLVSKNSQTALELNYENNDIFHLSFKVVFKSIYAGRVKWGKLSRKVLKHCKKKLTETFKKIPDPRLCFKPYRGYEPETAIALIGFFVWS